MFDVYRGGPQTRALRDDNERAEGPPGQSSLLCTTSKVWVSRQSPQYPGQQSSQRSQYQSIRVLVVLVTLAGVLAVMTQGASEYFFKENNSLRKFCCSAELEPGVGPACPVSGCCSVLTGYSN